MDSLCLSQTKESQLNMNQIHSIRHHRNNWLCQCDASFRSRHQALNSPLGHFNGDNARLSPNHQTHKTQGDSKVHFLQRQTRLSLNYGEHNPSHVRRYALPSQLYCISISSPYSQPFYETCSTNANYIFHAANKKIFLKTLRLRYLEPSPSYT